jgi:hypothetical protein
MKAFLIISIVLIGYFQAQAQSLTPFVIGSAGASFESPNGSLSWTIGEVITRTYQNQNFLTQGFHQPASIVVTGVQIHEDESLVVYPNPVRDVLHVQTSQTAQYHIELYNLQGQRLIDQEVFANEVRREHRMNVLEIPVALYILRVTNSSSGAVYYHKIEKH